MGFALIRVAFTGERERFAVCTDWCLGFYMSGFSEWSICYVDEFDDR